MTDKTQALLTKIQEQVSLLTTKKTWLDFLYFQTRFHTYSFRNSLLILSQRPQATKVAGFKTWKQMNRYVKKGEKGISILAPMVFKTKDQDESSEGSVVRFRSVSVFDLSQTDGEPLPVPKAPVKKLSGQEDKATSAFQALKTYAEEELGLTVCDEELSESNGYYDRTQNKIAISVQNETLQRAKTLAHEIGHAILHANENDRHERPVMEVEAESVAFIVMNNLGIDSGDYSFGYVAVWSQEKDFEKMIQDSGSRICKAADRVLSALNSEVQ